jgi:hypothetical protein
VIQSFDVHALFPRDPLPSSGEGRLVCAAAGRSDCQAFRLGLSSADWLVPGRVSLPYHKLQRREESSREKAIIDGIGFAAVIAPAPVETPAISTQLTSISRIGFLSPRNPFHREQNNHFLDSSGAIHSRLLV